MASSTNILPTVLAIAIALSGYLAAIRFSTMQKMAELPNDTDGEARRWELKKKLGFLTLADVPMVAAAFMLAVNLLWDRLFWGVAPAWLLSIALWSFFVGGSAMLALHGVAWTTTMTELIQGKK